MVDQRLRWSPHTAWVEQEDQITVALLPDGPVTVLTGADAVLSRMTGTFTLAELVEDARTEAAPEVVSGVHEFVASLRQLNLIVPVSADRDR